MRSAPNFGDLLLDRRPSHFVPPEMREDMGEIEAASESGPDIARAIARADSAMAALADTGESLDAATASLTVRSRSMAASSSSARPLAKRMFAAFSGVTAFWSAITSARVFLRGLNLETPV